MTPPETRYATTDDGLSIAYQVLGDGPPNVVWVPGFASHVELFWELRGFAHTYGRLGEFSRLAIFDKRGTGLSDRSLGTGTLEERMLDVRAVTDAAGMDSAVVVGTSEGAAMSVLFAATHPERVDALVLLGGDVTGSWVAHHPGLIETIEQHWGEGSLLQQLWLNGAGDRARLGRIERAMGTPRAMADQMRHNTTLDARPALGAITVPTLVLHCVDDPIVPVEAGRAIAAGIPGARLVEIAGGYHGSDRPEDMDAYVDEIEELVTGRRAPAASVAERVLSTVLFTDIVHSTDRAAAMGDQRWTRLLDQHDEIAREVVERYGGRWVKSTGDGVLATFDGPARAVVAADTLRHELAGMGLEIRAGVHTGEIELRAEDIGGIGVHIAARVAALARDGEVWVSPTVPGLVVGSGLAFEDRDEHDLKGVAGTWKLAALATSGAGPGGRASPV